MRTALLVTGYVIMTSIGAVAFGVLLFLVRHELSDQRARRHCERALSERAARFLSQQAREFGIRTGERVGRPDFLYTSADLPRETWADTHDELWVKLAEEGAALRLGDLR